MLFTFFFFFTYKILQYSHWYTSTFVDVTATYQQLWLQHKHCRASFSPSWFSLLLSSLSFLLLIPYTSLFLIFFLPACLFFLFQKFLNYTPQCISVFALVLYLWCSQSPCPTSLPNHTSTPDHQPPPLRFSFRAQFSKHVIWFATSAALFIVQTAAAPSCPDWM